MRRNQLLAFLCRSSCNFYLENFYKVSWRSIVRLLLIYIERRRLLPLCILVEYDRGARALLRLLLHQGIWSVSISHAQLWEECIPWLLCFCWLQRFLARRSIRGHIPARGISLLDWLFRKYNLYWAFWSLLASNFRLSYGLLITSEWWPHELRVSSILVAEIIWMQLGIGLERNEHSRVVSLWFVPEAACLWLSHGTALTRSRTFCDISSSLIVSRVRARRSSGLRVVLCRPVHFIEDPHLLTFYHRLQTCPWLLH